MKRLLVIIIGLVVLGGLGVLAYFFWLGPHTPLANSTNSIQNFSAGATTSVREIPAGSKEFRSQPFHFSILYPSDLTVKVYEESGGGITVTFVDAAEEKKFQIFAIPYTESTITSARFKLDEPSGVYQSPVDVIIGGTRATAFFSTNSIMGDTREVWFIKGGVLYEVTTYKELDTWLGQIMQNWIFL